MSTSVFNRNINVHSGTRVMPVADLKSQVKTVLDLEARIKQYNPAYKGNPVFSQHASYFGDPSQPGNGDNAAIIGEAESVANQVIRTYNSYNQSVNQTNEFLKSMADRVEIVGVPLGSILQLMGFFGSTDQTDPFQQYFKALMDAINDAHEAVAQSDLHKLMEDIQKSVSDARVATQATTDWVTMGKPAFDTYFSKYNVDSRTPLSDMMNIPARWQKVYDVDDYKQWEHDDYKPWTAYITSVTYQGGLLTPPSLDELSPLIPRQTGGLVYAYQLALPALLYTINARLAVLQSFFPDFRSINQSYKDEIHQWIDFLHQKLDEINTAVWIQDNEAWYNVTYSIPYIGSHYCCNLYTGEFVSGDVKKDTAFIQQYGPFSAVVKSFVAQRYLALHTPLLSGILTAIDKLYTIADAKPYTWHDWVDMGGDILGDGLGAVAIPNTMLTEVYVKGKDSHLWMSSVVENGSITGWSQVDNSQYLYSSPVAISKTDSHRSVFATAQNGSIIHKLFQDGAWHDWENLDGTTKGNVGAVAPGGDVLDIYVKGMDGFLYQQYFTNGKWSGWSCIDNTMQLASSPVVISDNPNHRAVYVHGADDTVYHKYWDGAQWHPWENLGRPPKQGYNKLPIVSVGAIADKHGVTDLFVRGDDLKLWQKTYNNGWNDWNEVETTDFTFQSAPAGVACKQYHRGIYVKGWDGKVHHRYWGE